MSNAFARLMRPDAGDVQRTGGQRAVTDVASDAVGIASLVNDQSVDAIVKRHRASLNHGAS